MKGWSLLTYEAPPEDISPNPKELKSDPKPLPKPAPKFEPNPPKSPPLLLIFCPDDLRPINYEMIINMK